MAASWRARMAMAPEQLRQPSSALDDTSAGGDYSGKTEAWSQGVHYGCGVSVGGLVIDSAHYIKDYEGTSFCGYLRCDNGACPQAITKKTKHLGGVCHQYEHFTFLRINYPLYAICLFLHPYQLPAATDKTQLVSYRRQPSKRRRSRASNPLLAKRSVIGLVETEEA